ncbi:hypothetical protein FisN_5Lh479 [Fistulifera solaris]|uniref:Leucine-rich repeat-containing N-terminal plant-type domain-containing protein n=1 Tax=Fistulifera solaris TaxID=1519565 RepID=A0A1Z5KH29_FISSO|nr:hypothetical protein FisN_5Lh479 [Fistulifera solaris]|eukprot:GAX25382.1 hypothetical protein FisN_5Lh479 [Fistulifera solaris]
MNPNDEKSDEKEKTQGRVNANEAKSDESALAGQGLTSPSQGQSANEGETTTAGTQLEKVQKLEQDIVSKQQNRPTAAATMPGAVSVGGSDRTSNAKLQVSSRATLPGAVSVSASSSLEQLERDINAKQAGSAGRNSLQALEQDLATKRQAGANSATTPGAVAVSASSSLEQLERDLNVKQAASVGHSTLQALEQDIATKRQAGGNVAAKPGAVAVSPSTSLEQLERDLHVKQAASVGRNNLQSLEQDIATKRQVGASAAATPGAVAIGTNALEQLERDIHAKQAGAGGRNTLQALEQGIATKRQAGGAVAAKPGAVAVGMSTSLQQLEQDLVRKHAPQRQGLHYEQGNAQGLASSKGMQFQGPSSTITDLLSKTQSVEMASTDRTVPSLDFQAIDAENDWKPQFSYGDYASEPDHLGVDVPPSPISEDISGPNSARNDPDPEQPALANPGVPFFAETVVDATGVAVISGKDEVNAEWERRSIKRLVCYGAALLVLVVIAAVVPAVLLSNNSEEETIATDPPTPAPSAAPTSASFPLLLERLSAITDISVLRNRESVQNKAAKWIASTDDYDNLQDNEAKLLQRYILAVFYFAMNGDSWNQCNLQKTCYASEQSWLSTTDECDWAAVGCDDNGIIEKLNFEQAEREFEQGFFGPDEVFVLNSRLPAEIGKLSNLKLFHLPRNRKTSGILSVFSTLAKLESLYLEGNSFTGDISALAVDAHPNLALFNVARNGIKGSLPTSLAKLDNLTTLLLEGNGLSGQIPSEMGLAPKLEILNLQNNKFSGSIPTEIYNGNLQELQLAGNDIEGSLPSSISLMTNLRVLNLGNTSMSGELPNELFRLPVLSELHLSNANFGSELSEDFRGLNATIMELSLDGNNFSGVIPVAFDDLMILELLRLGNNPLLSGAVSTALCSRRGTGLGKLEELSVGCNIECNCCGDRSCP